MATNWVVTTAAERITLNEQRKGETTFTVTNPGPGFDRAVFDVVPGDGAEAGWFTVEEPQRRVPATTSVSYLLKVGIPPTAPAGQYSIQGRVYSADSAPEEDSVLSSRVVVEAKAPAQPTAKPKPWWLLAVAALVVLVLVVVGWLIFRPSGKPEAKPTATPSAAQVNVPDVTKQTEAQATANLQRAGLTVGTIKHRAGAPNDSVLQQSIAGDKTAAPGTAIDLVIAVSLTPSKLTGPPSGGRLARNTAPLLTWTQNEKYVTRWQVLMRQEVCSDYLIFLPNRCGFINPVLVVVTAPRLQAEPAVRLPGPEPAVLQHRSGRVAGRRHRRLQRGRSVQCAVQGLRRAVT